MLINDKNKTIRDGKIRHNQKLSTAKAKIHYLAGRVKEQIELLEEKDSKFKKQEEKVCEWKKKEAQAKSKVIKLEKQLREYKDSKEGSPNSSSKSDYDQKVEDFKSHESEMKKD